MLSKSGCSVCVRERERERESLMQLSGLDPCKHLEAFFEALLPERHGTPDPLSVCVHVCVCVCVRVCVCVHCTPTPSMPQPPPPPPHQHTNIEHLTIVHLLHIQSFRHSLCQCKTWHVSVWFHRWGKQVRLWLAPPTPDIHSLSVCPGPLRAKTSQRHKNTFFPMATGLNNKTRDPHWSPPIPTPYGHYTTRYMNL